MRQKLFTYILAALCAVAAFSCKKAEEDFIVDPLQEREVFLTVSMGLNTRSVSVSSEAIAASWQEGDELQLVRDGAVVTTLKVTSIFGQKAMLSGTVKGAYPAGTSFDLYYGGTSYMYAGQMGTAASAAIRGYLKVENVTIASQDNKTLTLSAATLQHQQAYFELSFQYGPDKLKVKRVEITGSDKIVRSKAMDGTTEYFSDTNPFVVAASGAEGAEVVYFAMRDEKTETFNYTFKVYPVGSDTPYEAEWKWEGENGVSNPLSKTGPAVNGTYNAGTWVLNRQSTNANVPQAISILWDGQPHELVTVNALTYGAGSAEAEGAKMLFYVADKQDADAVLDANAVAALAPGDNATWSTEIPVATDPGQYYIWYKVIGGRYFEDIPATLVKESGAVTDTDPTDNRSLIDKRSLTVTAPTGIANLKYTGSAQALVNAGAVKDKDSEEFDPGLPMKYYFAPVPDPANPPVASVTEEDWSTALPQAVYAGSYKVWYKVDGSDHYYAAAAADPIDVTIDTKDAVVTNAVPIENLVYNGAAQQLVLAADADDGCKVYYYTATAQRTRTEVVGDENITWSLEIPAQKDAGTYYVWTKVVDDSGAANYSGITGVSDGPVMASIGQAPLTVTVPALADTWTYDAAAHQLFKATPATAVTYKNASNENADALSETPKATLYYKATGGSWTAYDPADTNTPNATLPKATNAGEYHLYYYVDGGQNFKSQGTADQPVEIAGSVTVDKVTPSFTTAVTAKTSLVYNGAAQALVNAGAVDFGELQYCVNTSDTPSDTWTTTPPAGTDARVDPDYYYVFTRVIGNDNINTINAPASGGIQVEIAQAPLYVTLPSYVDGPLSYSGSYQRLLQDDGLLQYRNANDELETVTSSSVARMEFCWYNKTRDAGIQGPFAADELEGKDAGEYYAYYKVYRGANFVQNKIQLYNGSAFVETSNTYGPAYGDYIRYSSYITIDKVDPVITQAPVVAENLAYTGSAQSLVLDDAEYDGGKSSSYLVTDSDDPVPGSGDAVGWVGTASLSSDALKRTNAGTYYVWTRIAGDDNHTAVYVHPTPVAVTIAPGTNPGFANANRPVAATGLVSNNTDHTLVDASSVTVNTGGTLKYSIGSNTEPSDTWVVTPTGKLAGTYYVWYKIDGGGNYEDSDPVLLTVHIGFNSQAFTVGVRLVDDELKPKKVYFSPGNLQATTSDYGATWTWDFAPHQHVVLGSGSANVAYVNEYSMSSAVSKNGSVDLFGWSTSETENYYGINSSTYSASFQGTFVDWGTLPIAGDAAGTWRTLTKDEWVYLLGKEGESSRTNAVDLRTIRTVNGVNGLVILPDGCSVSIDADWGVLEAAGAVFLPVEGTRNNRTVSYKSSGYYWSSTRKSGSDQSAHGVLFYLSGATINVLPEHSLSLQDGFSVRLVKNAP